MITIPISFYRQRNSDKLFRIELFPEEEPINGINFTVEFLPLRYGKKHAITYEMDDTLLQIYSNVFKLLNGGQPYNDTEISSGLSHTNGFGNLIKFRGSSVGSSYLTNGNSILSNPNSTMYINWDQHLEMYNAGWGLMGNHGSYSVYNNVSSGSMISWETLMKAAFELRYNRNPLYAVLQGGNLGTFNSSEWINWLITNCGVYLKVMGSGNGPDQIDISTLKLLEFLQTNNTVYQTGRYLFDGKTESALLTSIDTFMAKSGNFWFRTYSHSVKPGGNTEYTVFKSIMQYIQNTYGSGGIDNVWFPSVTEMIEYLVTKEKTVISVENSEPFKYDLSFDVSNVPVNIFNRSMTLKITSDYPIKSVITNGYNAKFSGINTNTLIVDLQSQ